MLMKLKQKEKKNYLIYKKKTSTYILCFDIQVQNTEYMICRSKSGKHVEIIVKEL